jgi:hypothetical protein
MEAYTLIASFVHGNALGVVLQPHGVEKYFADFECKWTWQVRIGPLVPEAAIDTEYPKEDYQHVVDDLVAFCTKHGIQPRGLDSQP